MSALSDKTRLGLQVLGAGTALGIVGDALLRAIPWGLNAFLCTAALVAATAVIVRRQRIPVSGDAPWLAVTALLLASNFLARDSGALRAFDALGLVIVGSLACFSLRGVALRGRSVWDYLLGGVGAAPSACLRLWPLLGPGLRWSELPSGGALRQAPGPNPRAPRPVPPLPSFGGLFPAAEPGLHNPVAGRLRVH